MGDVSSFGCLKRWWHMYTVDRALQLLVHEAGWLIYLTIYANSTKPCVRVKPLLNVIQHECLFWKLMQLQPSVRTAPNVMLNCCKSWRTITQRFVCVIKLFPNWAAWVQHSKYLLWKDVHSKKNCCFVQKLILIWRKPVAGSVTKQLLKQEKIYEYPL